MENAKREIVTHAPVFFFFFWQTLSYGAVNASSGDAVKSITERQNVLKQTY